jgi:hypothetical protein
MKAVYILCIIMASMAIAAAIIWYNIHKKSKQGNTVTNGDDTTIKNVFNKLQNVKSQDYINVDLSDEGYNNAIMNCEEGYKTKRLSEIKERGKLLCNKEIAELEKKIIDFDAAIKVYEEQLYLITKAETEREKEKHENDKTQITNILNALGTNANLPVYTSYERGFLKGAEANLRNRFKT